MREPGRSRDSEEKILPLLVKSAPGSEMADRENVLKRRKSEKFMWKYFGKGVLYAIEEKIDPEFAVLKFHEYTAAASRVLELCAELATYDEDDSLEETENVVFMENFEKETQNIVFKYLTYSKNFKENAAKIEEIKDAEECEFDFEQCEIKTELVYDKSENEYDESECEIENFDDPILTVLDQSNLYFGCSQKEKIEEIHQNAKKIDFCVCDVTLAGDDKLQITQKRIISRSDEKQKKKVRSKPVMKLQVETNHDNFFVCENCEERFEKGKSLKNHIVIVNEQSLPEDLVKKETFSETFKKEFIVCEHCEKRFKKGKCPKSHIEAVHGQAPLGASLLTRSLFCPRGL